MRLVDIPVHTALDPLRCIAREMVRLALHRPHTGVLVEEPVAECVVLGRAPGIGDFVVGVVLLDEVLQDADISHWGWVTAAGWAGVNIEEFSHLKAREERMAARGVEKGQHVPEKHEVKELL